MGWTTDGVAWTTTARLARVWGTSAASAIGQASRQRREFEVRVTNAALAVGEETDKLPDAERRRGRSAKAGASVRAAPIRPCRNSHVSGLQSTCGIQTQRPRDGAPSSRMEGRRRERLSGEEAKTTHPFHLPTRWTTTGGWRMDARTASLLPRSIAPRLAVPAAQGHGAGVSRNNRRRRTVLRVL
ncbi:hypothetical protein BJ912DRAFT_416266 [Pholiota molesta]|nr:hypothetical protein BJ912DRAFT_416266 [Pholiota molesta]